MTCKQNHSEIYAGGSTLTDGQFRNVSLALRKGQIVTVHYHYSYEKCALDCTHYESEKEFNGANQ